ncbi:MAG: hypothetical protein J5998_04600, partial [Clostridia bacterium]|nr:hypothetical protein [Clostridia bacterium]
ENYALANEKIIENCRFYIENTDVRDDRDSFYWNIGELCRVMLHFGKNGDQESGLVTPEAEAVFRKMAMGYCHDMSKLNDAEYSGNRTWRVYESENHHVQRDSALWQLMNILLDDPKNENVRMADGGTLREHFDAWSAFFKAWIRQRAGKSMFIEVQSRVYGIHTIKNIYPLYDMSSDPELKRLAGNIITLFWALWAQEQINGVSGGGQSRVYPESARKTHGEAADWAWYYTGMGNFTPPREMEYVMLDSAWRMPEVIARLASGTEQRGEYEIMMRPLGYALPEDKFPNYRPDPENGRIYRYSWCTPDFIVGTQMYPQCDSVHWCLISSQNRYHGVIYGEEDAQLLPIPEPLGMHNLHSVEPNITFNAFWAMQKKGTLITQKNHGTHDAGRMRVWLSDAGGVSDVTEKGGWLFLKSGKAYSAVKVVRGGCHLEKAGKDKPINCNAEGAFLICEDEWTPVITETARQCNYASFDAFIDAVCGLKATIEGETMHYTGLYGNTFIMKLDGSNDSTIDGEPYVKEIDVSVGSPFVNMPWKGTKAEITFDGGSIALDFA